MREYTKARMEIIAFETEDVIGTSNGSSGSMSTSTGSWNGEPTDGPTGSGSDGTITDGDGGDMNG